MVWQLTSVMLVLHHQPLDSTSLHHIGLVISSFLGPPPNLSLSDACSFKSIRFLDWIWSVSCTSSVSRAKDWTLTNYLRSEPHYYQWQFWKITQIAANIGDLRLMQWIFSHFTGCAVPVDVVEESANQGQLEILEFLLEKDVARYRRHKRRAITVRSGIVPYESIPQIPAKLRKEGNTVHWGGRSIILAIENNHPQVARWLYENTPHELDNDEVRFAIEYALRYGAVELAEFLLPQGTRLVDYARDDIHADVAMMLLNSGQLRQDEEAAAASLQAMITVDRLDLMKQIEQLYSPSPMSSIWARVWYFGTVEACKSGNLPIARWLLEHPVGQEVCAAMRDEHVGGKNDFLYLAAANGHLPVMMLLNQQGAVTCAYQFNHALIGAVRNGHLPAAAWLLHQYPFSPRSILSCVIQDAAKHGHLEILKYFHRLHLLTDISGERPRKMMDIAAKHGHLDVVKWLHANYSDACSTKAMDDAATNGHLDVVQWLYTNRREGCTRKAMNGAAANGHLEVLRWLHTNTSTGCTTHAMDLAAGRGHLKVLKWLRANRSEGCTVKAIENALQQSHVQVLSWIHHNYPELVPSDGNIVIRAPNQFDVLLFLRQYYPHVFFSRGTSSEPAIGVVFQLSETHIQSWLREKFTAATLVESVAHRSQQRR